MTWKEIEGLRVRMEEVNGLIAVVRREIVDVRENLSRMAAEGRKPR